MGKWIRSQRNIIDFTLSSLLRKKRRNIALTLVYTIVVFFLASVLFFTYALKKEAATILQGSPDIIVQKMAAGRHELIPLTDMDKIKNIRGILAVNKRLWGYYYDPIAGANYTVIASNDKRVAPGKILIGEGVSRTRLLYMGDTLEFRTHEGTITELEIAGRLPAESELVSSDLVLISEGDFRRVFGTPNGYATDLTLTVGNPREIPTIAVKIAERLPDTRQILKDEILRTYDTVFNWRGGIMVVILTGALLAFSIFVCDRASGLSQDDRREIGILKAIGWETSDVLMMKFWEGMIVSLASFLTGIILAYIHVFFASSMLFEPVLRGWSVLYPRFNIRPYIDADQIVVIFFLTVVPYTVATIVPSWRTATVDPDAAMRA